MRHVSLCGGGIGAGDCCAAGVGVACVFATSPFDAHAMHATRVRQNISVNVFARIKTLYAVRLRRGFVLLILFE
jgi:hypothetical protein